MERKMMPKHHNDWYTISNKYTYIRASPREREKIIPKNRVLGAAKKFSFP
jgi:hypothetical protein